MRSRRLFAPLTVLLLAATCAKASDAAAQANVAPGLWRLAAFNDATPGMNPMANHTLCFLPNGTWYATTFPNWGGRWFQKGANAAGNGDRVRLLGNYAGGDGNDGAELHFFHRDLMAGAWTEWRDPGAGQFIAWATVTLTRAGRECPPQPRAVPRERAREERRNPVTGQ